MTSLWCGTPAAAQALCRNVTYENVSNAPSVLARTLRFTLSDGDGGTSNQPTLTVNLSAGETCDDGNIQNDDGCINNCIIATCGDGYLWAGMEICDDGGLTATCDSDPWVGLPSAAVIDLGSPINLGEPIDLGDPLDLGGPESGGDLPNPGDVKNCGDFDDYGEARAWFDTYVGTYGDVARLDGDGDGFTGCGGDCDEDDGTILTGKEQGKR